MSRGFDRVKLGCLFSGWGGVVVELGLRYVAWVHVIPGSNPGDPTISFL